MEAIRYIGPIWLGLLYSKQQKEASFITIKMRDKFAFQKTDTDRAISIPMVMPIDNILVYIHTNTLYGRRCVLGCVANFWLICIYPLQGYEKSIKTCWSVHSTECLWSYSLYCVCDHIVFRVYLLLVILKRFPFHFHEQVLKSNEQEKVKNRK